MDDLHLLPKFRDAISSVYVEHVWIDRHEKAIAVHDKPEWSRSRARSSRC
jgi:hypothetical protein